MLTSQEAADALGVCVKTLYNRVCAGKIPATRGPRRALLFSPADIQKHSPKPVSIPSDWVTIAQVEKELGLRRSVIEGWVLRGRIHKKIIHSPKKQVLVSMEEVKKIPYYPSGMWPRGKPGYGTTPGRYPRRPRQPTSEGMSEKWQASGQSEQKKQTRRRCASCGRAAVPPDLRMLCRNCYKNKGTGVFDI